MQLLRFHNDKNTEISLTILARFSSNFCASTITRNRYFHHKINMQFFLLTVDKSSEISLTSLACFSGKTCGTITSNIIDAINTATSILTRSRCTVIDIYRDKNNRDTKRNCVLLWQGWGTGIFVKTTSTIFNRNNHLGGAINNIRGCRK